MKLPRLKLFSIGGDMLFNLSNLKNCINYPKFVLDYIKKVQSILKGHGEMCYFCFPVVEIPSEPYDASEDSSIKFFAENQEFGMDIPLSWENGEWVETKGLIFKKRIPVKDPALWLYNYIVKETGEDDPEVNKENKKEPDYPYFEKALNTLKGMIGKYK